MFRAVFVRTLKPGVTDQQFIDAWMPPGRTTEAYPCSTTISHSATNERQVISIFEIDAPAEELSAVIGSLVHPDSADRLDDIVESTQLETVFQDSAAFGSTQALSGR